MLRENTCFDRKSYTRIAKTGWLGVMFTSEGELGPSDLAALHRAPGRRSMTS
ncbi:MAG: hypothetical protein Q7J57_18185 [Gemmobacter sp.]|nr:hypothetical protein [Gemmobacter sp.]